MGQLEGVFWRTTLKPRVEGKWIRIENPLHIGTPDSIALVGGVTSWVELKSKNVFLPGLGTTGKQRQFMGDWCSGGGTAYLLARVGSEILFLWGQDVERDLSPVQWRDRALVHGMSTRDFDFQLMGRIMSGEVPHHR